MIMFREVKNKWIRDKYDKKLFLKKYTPTSENADEAAIKLEMAKVLIFLKNKKRE